MKATITKIFGVLAFAAMLSSCMKKDKAAENLGNYILAVTPVASTGVADYLLTAGDLEKGTISTAGNGVEQDGTYRYYVTSNNKFFSMLYGQGNPGAVTTYNILDGRINKLSNFQTETVQAFAPVNDDLLLVKISRNITNPLSSWYRISTNSLLITGEGTVNTQTLSNNGETAHFSWIKQVGNKVYAPYFSIKGCCGDSFGTAYPNNAWIAVYSYPQMQLEKVIKDDRTSFIGRYMTNGLAVVENGDVYAFSSSVATTNGVLSSTKPSAITRITAGTTEFDQSYFYDFEAISGGYVVTDWLYIGNNNFVVNVILKAQRGAYSTGKTIAIVNVVDKTFKQVTGLPLEANIESITTNNYTPKDGKLAYIGVNMKGVANYVYKIDASTQTATQGLKVEGGVITAIQYIK
ncbi:hypothetical protein DBR11_16050 [Pedobacter sp. HMWF019]|uniref:DUF4374 domain-containing protein n=1 Tax=Pedobacter sp. HMWF019 TaxID=2056856 RepID=UPI000D3B4AAD|nr:DUF4374 domain-containing protein [Pedobacter sp. HMWF019]PTS98022.1 hypothetical protein DBR11_16050 [Pedobacter sp. HMWF019]